MRLSGAQVNAETSKPDDVQEIPDGTFMDNVHEARECGYDMVCVECGVGLVDGLEIHERGCSLWTPLRD